MNLGEYEKMSEKEKMEYWAKDYRHITEQDITPAAEALSAALNDKELMEQTVTIMKELTDGAPINIDPLTEIPEPEMRLYGIHRTYFESEEELESYCRSKSLSMDDTCVLEYLRSIAGCSDVIRKTYKDGRSKLYTAVDEDGYGTYHHERSVYRGEFVWEFNYGSIREMYIPFRDRGITFENDVYRKIDERNDKILKMCRQENNSSGNN